MVKYFYKEYSSDMYGRTHGVGYLDTDKTFHDEGADYISTVIFLELGKDSISVREEKDIIDATELESLHYITEKDYNTLKEFMESFSDKAKDILNNIEK